MTLTRQTDKITIPDRLPFLEAICWQTANVYRFTPEEMLSRYERGWQYRDLFGDINDEELNFIRKLAQYYRSWLQSETMTFKFDLHDKILTILDRLNCELLKERSVCFGGGTLLAIAFGEYRLSKDIDLIVNAPGYKHLRNSIFDRGYEALFRDFANIQIGRKTSDRYGIRMSIGVDNLPIKTEIIVEARFNLDPPQYLEWSPVPCLSLSDCFTSKLLANADRFMDSSVESRDLIDLAVLRLQSPLPDSAVRKAENAYEVMRPLKQAVQQFQERANYRDKCFVSLQIDKTQIPKIIDGLDLLAADLELDPTERTFQEQHDS